MNPIYIEYYSHDDCDCYKIDLPWSEYHKETRVLCPVSKEKEFTEIIAVGVINQHLQEILKEEIKRKIE